MDRGITFQLYGEELKIDKDGMIKCPECYGSGYSITQHSYREDYFDCDVCQGDGKISWIEVMIIYGVESMKME